MRHGDQLPTGHPEVNMSNSAENRRKCILDIYLANQTASKKTIAKKSNASLKTVYNVINNYMQGNSFHRAPGSGRKTGPSNKDV